MSTNCEEYELLVAAMNGDLAEVKRLVIDCGIDPNIQDDVDGSTPLHDAAEKGYFVIVKILLEHGAEPNIQNYIGWTPLHLAAANGYFVIVKILLEHGAEPNIQDNDGSTPLHKAVANCRVGVARVLLEHGADPTIRDKKGRTPLDIGSNCEEIIEELRRGGSRTRVYE